MSVWRFFLLLLGQPLYVPFLLVRHRQEGIFRPRPNFCLNKAFLLKFSNVEIRCRNEEEDGDDSDEEDTATFNFGGPPDFASSSVVSGNSWLQLSTLSLLEPDIIKLRRAAALVCIYFR